MRSHIEDFGNLFKVTFTAWNLRDPFRQSAVIAYYAVFSIPGLLFLVITIAGYFYGRDVVSENILGQISGTMGADTAEQIGEILAKATQAKSTVVGSIIGIVVLLMGATGVFVEMQKTLNMIWEVKAVPQKGFWPYIKSRLFSFGLILAIAFLLMISLVVSAAIAAMGKWIKVDTSNFMVAVFTIINFILSLAIISLLFALIFKILPDARIKWRHVWMGSVITGLLFEIGKTALAFYFGKAEPASVYGTAGSVVLILLWVSYSSMILFFGAEFTNVFAKKYSGVVPPTEIAKKTPPTIPKEA